MSLTREPTIQALNRIYCYLRLSGASEAATGAHLQECTAALTGSGAPEDLWAQLDARLLAAQARGELKYPAPEAPPELRRGHVRYPDR
jgi:hypothetical protein